MSTGCSCSPSLSCITWCSAYAFLNLVKANAAWFSNQPSASSILRYSLLDLVMSSYMSIWPRMRLVCFLQTTGASEVRSTLRTTASPQWMPSHASAQIAFTEAYHLSSLDYVICQFLSTDSVSCRRNTIHHFSFPGDPGSEPLSPSLSKLFAAPSWPSLQSWAALRQN